MELRQIFKYAPYSSTCRPGESIGAANNAPKTDATNAETTNTGATNEENKEQILADQTTNGRRKCSKKAKGKRTLNEESDEEVRKPK